MRPMSEFSDCRNRSQAGQDVFALAAHKWKREGFYLDIGANDPVLHNNTRLAYDEFGWYGVAVEIDARYRGAWAARRPRDTFIVGDALSVVRTLTLPDRVDYLSLDIDPPEATLAVLQALPHDHIRFSVITFEHDVWRGDDRVRHFSRQFLSERGYKLAVPDVKVRVEWPDKGPDPVPFEDFWVCEKFARENGISV